jgi:hypothetical protein
MAKTAEEKAYRENWRRRNKYLRRWLKERRHAACTLRESQRHVSIGGAAAASRIAAVTLAAWLRNRWQAAAYHMAYPVQRIRRRRGISGNAQKEQA